MLGFDGEETAADARGEGRSTEEMQAAAFRNSLRGIPGPSWEFIIGSLVLRALTLVILMTW